MFKKVICLTLVLVSLFSLSSCFLLDDGTLDSFIPDENTPNGGTTNITVNGGNNYEVSINGGDYQEALGAAKALLSTVSIICGFESYPFGSGKTESYYSAGSGVIYQLDKENGSAYIITNYHVVYDADANTENKISRDISLYLYGQEFSNYEIKASYVGGSMLYDLAVLEVKNSQVLMKSEAMAASLADSNDVSILEMAIAIGNPEGEGLSATVGYVNVDSEDITMLASDNRTEMELRVIRTDAAVNGGNSGGGLYNSRGELIGIVNAKMSNEEIDNIGYAIPSNVAKAIADNILYYCKDTTLESVQRVLLGVTVSSSESYSRYNPETGKIRKYETVIVTDVSATSAVSGIVQANDIVNSITIDGKTYEVSRIFHVVDSMLNARPGSSVTMNVTRGEQALELAIPITQDMLTAYR